MKARAAINCPFRPHSAIVALDDATNISQPDARTFKLRAAMQPLKYAEKLVHILHVEAHAIVPNGKYGVAVLGLAADFVEALAVLAAMIECPL